MISSYNIHHQYEPHPVLNDADDTVKFVRKDALPRGRAICSKGRAQLHGVQREQAARAAQADLFLHVPDHLNIQPKVPLAHFGMKPTTADHFAA